MFEGMITKHFLIMGLVKTSEKFFMQVSRKEYLMHSQKLSLKSIWLNY